MTSTEGLRAESPERAKLYVERDMREIELFDFAQGQAAVFSMRSPASDGVNEDAAGVFPHRDGGCLVVADGAGGLRGGAQASRTTVNRLHAELEDVGRSGSRREAILEAIEGASREILDLGIGAATTVAVVQLDEGRLRPFHVGDSQILVATPTGALKLLTVAHSPVGYALHMGLLDEDQALRHEERHLLYNVVGLQDMTIEMGMPIELERGDTVLLACDGLFDNLKVSEVVERAVQPSLGDAVKALVEDCIERMAAPSEQHPSKPDDLTLVAYRVR